MSRRERPRFSILLPTHDRAEVVGFAVDSILRQTEPDFELLVVGDGCTDDTSEVVLGYGDPRIRWFDLPKAPGFGYANRNLALREARGDLIAYLAHDDLALPDHLELMARPFEDDEVEWVYSRPLWVSGEGTVVPFAMDLGRPEQLDYFLTTANTLPASCVVHRRGCFEKYGYWPEEIPHSGDWELWKRMLRDAGGGNLAYVPEGSILHFRANWRGTAWAPRPFDAWHAAASGDSWPAALRVDVPAEGLVQRSFAELLRRDGAAWCRSLREATPRVIESLAWNQAIALPIQIDAARPLVSELLASGAHERALAVAERMVAVAPADAELQYARGRALLGLGRSVAAERALRKSADLDPGSAEVHAQLSLAVHRQGRLEDAIALAGLAASLAPESADLQAHLGNLLVAGGRASEARMAYLAALRLDPELEAATRGLKGLQSPA